MAALHAGAEPWQLFDGHGYGGYFLMRKMKMMIVG